MAKVLVFGTGGVGCIYTYICQKGGATVTAVCRSNYNAVKKNGMTIQSALWGLVTCCPDAVSSVSEAAAQEGQWDFILVCSKAFAGTAKLIREAVGKDTAIVIAQNGIDIEAEYAELYPHNTIISGVVYLPTTQTKPGYCIHGPLELFEIGTYPATASAEAKRKVQDLSAIFAKAGAHAPVYDDIQRRRWIKLAVNAAWNPTTALSLCDDANLLRSSALAQKVIVAVFKEVSAIAEAVGYPGLISDEEIARQMERSLERARTGGKEPSMLTDVKNHRAMEVETILGNAVRLAERLGVEVKHLELLYVLAKGRNYQITAGDDWLPLAM